MILSFSPLLSAVRPCLSAVWFDVFYDDREIPHHSFPEDYKALLRHSVLKTVHVTISTSISISVLLSWSRTSKQKVRYVNIILE